MAWMGNPDTPGASDLLVTLEARAVDIITSETERYFGASTVHSEIISGEGCDRIWLNEAPTAVTSVEERCGAGDDWTAIDGAGSDGWELRAPVSISGVTTLHRKNGLTWLFGHEYRVTYSFGYASGSEPAEIRQAVLDLVALKYNERGREGLRSETIGDYSWTALADSMGNRDLRAVPGWGSMVRRWRRGTRMMA